MSRKHKKQHDPAEPRADVPPTEQPLDEDLLSVHDPADEVEFVADVAAAREGAVDECESLRGELAEAKDRVLRVQAELENYRKRSAREMLDQRRYAQLPLMRDLLPALDNLHRAIESAEQTDDTAGLLEGVKMVTEQLDGVLTKNGCQKIEALGEPFDPHLHEAISQQPSADYPENTVMLVTQAGFQLHDRVVRPSQVIVSKSDE